MDANANDIKVLGTELYLLPVKMRVPLKFGAETMTEVTCARVRVRVGDGKGRTAEGWGETPMSVQWVWPKGPAYAQRHERLIEFCERIAKAWAGFDSSGHPLEIGVAFQEHVLTKLVAEANAPFGTRLDQIPWLAALVCCSPFDLAVHDAYGRLHGRPLYEMYTAEFMSRDLAAHLEPAAGADISFRGRFPVEFLSPKPPARVRAWHLVGGLDWLEKRDQNGAPVEDGHPVFLVDWIRRDGLTCLKIKLRGNDAAWDHERIVRVGQIAIEHGVEWLSTDFNCTVEDARYVNELLDRLRDDDPRIYGMVLYVEQPFPYELDEHRIDAHSVSARKPLFLDESAHDWRMIRLGRELGWTGVALKTCKTQTGAILSACWAKAHGMTLMVQDLTNPMLAQIPHVLLAGHAGTIMGVETNSMQFYPAASSFEEAVHPGLYQRRGGCVSLESVRGSGFGYRIKEMRRVLPPARCAFGDWPE